MKIKPSCFKAVFFASAMLMANVAVVNASIDDIFYKMSTATTINPAAVKISAPGNFTYSAAAPVPGTSWNLVDMNTVIPDLVGANTTTTYSGNNQASGGLVVDANGNTLSGVTLTITYVNTMGSATAKTQPSTGAGENTIQSGGVMQYAFRDYYGGNLFVYSFSGLPASTPFNLYIYGGGSTTAALSGLTLSLAPANQYGATTTNALITDSVANSAGNYGAIWTGTSPGYSLLATGNSWTVLQGQTDINGNFVIVQNGNANTSLTSSYLNGFQLVRVPISTFTMTGGGADCSSEVIGLSGSETGVNYQLYNGSTAVGSVQAGTGSSLTWTVTSSGTYTVVGTVINGSNTGMSATMTGNAAVTINPATTITLVSPTFQQAAVGATVTMAVTTGGTPPTTYVWEDNDTVLSDGLQSSGSTISGSATATLTITNAQDGDSATSGQGYTCTVSGGCGSPTSPGTTLLVSSTPTPPVVGGLTNETAIANSNTTFTAFVGGVPAPALQWYLSTDGGATSNAITGATSFDLTVTNVQYSQNDDLYTLVATNDSGSVSSNATLTVIVPVNITVQPTNTSATNGTSATFSVTASGVPAPAYQWYYGTNSIAGATGSSYTIGSVSPAIMGGYSVVVTNIINVVTSSVATLTVNSAMGYSSLTPSNGATNVCYDTPLYLTMSATPILRTAGTVKIFNATNLTTPVDTVDLSQCVTNVGGDANSVQPYTIGGQMFSNFPVIISGNNIAIYPHHGVMTSNQTYYVTIDDGVFQDSAGAYFSGINAGVWQFSTKPTGPANPTNLVVAQDYSGDFATVQGAVDSVPANNNTPTIINIRNGSYVELININSKNDLDFRGQSRTNAVIGYANNNNVYGGAPWRCSFVMNGNNCTLENLTLTNRTVSGGSQAEAVDVEGTHDTFYNMELDSYQDTFLVSSAGDLVYFQDCLIQGQTDFNWGYGTVYYTNCDINCVLSGGHVTQPRSPAGADGFGFYKCTITQGYSGSSTFDLGRTISTPTSPSEVLFADCLMASVVTGYNSDASTNMTDYADSNLTATASITLANSIHLASNNPFVINIQSAPTWLSGWTPVVAPYITSQPTNVSLSHGQSTSLKVSVTGVPFPTYQWFQNGTSLASGTNATFPITSAQRTNNGSYYVVVSNTTGSVTSSIVSLTYIDTPPVASPVSYTRYVNVPLDIFLTNLLANVTDADGDSISLAGVGVSTNGVTLQANADDLVYEDTNNVNDQFSYTVTDGFGGTNSSLVSIIISSNSVFGATSPAINATGGTPTLTYSGIPGYSYSVERSMDLVHWTVVLTTNVPAGGVFQFTDPNAPQAGAYYVLQYNY